MEARLFCIFLLCWPVLLSGQWARRDSLLALAENAPTDSARVQRIMEAGKLYLGNHPDSALLLFERAERLAAQSGYRRGVARCRINAAYALLDQGQHERALQCCTEAIPICTDLKMGKELVAAYNSMGNVYNYRGDRPKAIEHYVLALKTLDWAEGLPPHFRIGVQNNLAMLYVGMHDFEKGREQAEQSYRQALAAGDEHSAALAAQHIATALQGLDRSAESVPYLESSIRLARKTGQTKVGISMLTVLASLHTKAGRYDEARRLYADAATMARDFGDPYSLMITEHGLGEMALYQRRYDEARRHTLAALAHALDMKLDDYQQSLYLLLSDIALAEGDLRRYDEYRGRYQHLRDTLLNAAVVYATTELETRYQTEKKQQQIDQLQQEQEIQALRLRQRNALMLGFAGLSVLLALLGFFGYRTAAQRRRLAEQEVVIQQQKIRELENEKQLAAVDAMLRGQEEERARLARDLHDGLGGLLSGIKQSVHALLPPLAFRETAGDTATADQHPPGLAANLARVEERLDRSIHELRQVSRNLMPEALLRFGLKDAVHDYCDHLGHARGLHIHFQAYGLDDRRLDRHVEVILFRIIQELLNNIVRHAAATEAIVQLILDADRLHLTVEDNGRGFDPQKIAAPGIGWLNIRSRVDYLGGRLDVHSEPDRGTSVSVEIAVNADREAPRAPADAKH